jgi:phosphonate metabolism protein (transferase hexapeptide repeat family)
MKTLSRDPLIHHDTRLVNCRFGAYTEIGEHSYLENTVMDDYSYSGPFCIFQNTDIGKFSNIAAMVRIGPTNHPMDRPTQHHFTYRRTMYGFDTEDDSDFFQWRAGQKTEIGHDTWLGHGAVIMTGIRIGIGAVIGAGAVVTKDVPDYSITAGVPARHIRYRFTSEQQKDLLDIAWWEWSHETINKRFEDFLLPVNRFISKYRKEKKTS